MTQLRDALHVELATLRERNAYLEEENRQLKDDMLVTTWPAKWRLTPIDSRLLRALYTTPGVLSMEGVKRAIWPAGCYVDDERLNVAVNISRLRRRLRPLDVKVLNQWGTGYSISADDKAKLKAMVAG